MSTDFGFCRNVESSLSVSSLRVSDLTVCFQDVVLGIIPFTLFLVVFAVQGLSRRRARIPFKVSTPKPTWIFLSLCALASIAFSAVRIAFYATSNSRGPIPAPIIITLAQCLAFALHFLDHRATSSAGKIRGSIVCLWIWTAISSAIKLRTLVISEGERDNSYLAITIGSLCVAVLWVLIQEIAGLQALPGSDACRRDTAGFLNYITFSYIWPTIRLARQRQLQKEDIWPLPKDATTDDCYLLLRDQLPEAEIPKPSSVRLGQFCSALLRSQYVYFAGSLVFSVGRVLLLLLQPLLLDLLINFVKSHQKDAAGNYIVTPQPLSNGYLIAAGMLIAGLLASLCSVWSTQMSWALYYRWKYATSNLVFRKSLRLSASSRAKNPTGTVSNLISNDCMEVGFLAVNLPVIAYVVQLILGLVLIWQQLSYATLAGIAVAVLLVPGHIYNAKFIGRWCDQKFSTMDKRMSLTTEVMSGIKVIKMYAWESFFLKQIDNIRKKELRFLLGQRVGDVFGGIIGNLPPVIMFAVTIAVYAAAVAKGTALDVNKVFVSFALFNMLKAPLYELSFMLPSVAVSWSCITRVVEFLNEEERQDYRSHAIAAGSIEITGGQFAWGSAGAGQEDKERTQEYPKDDAKPVLTDINLSVKPGSFIALVGNVGSGKSSLLSAIMAQIVRQEGKISVGGEVAYVSQKAWIFRGTVRDNILICRHFDAERYQMVLRACALTRDLELWKDGDMTEIGEKGVNLSGGQRQRISLARAVYGHADIYLFDDVLSAVDPHVAKHIQQNVLGPKGILFDKTRILSTHSMHALEDTDYIAIIENSTIRAFDTYPKLAADDTIRQIQATTTQSNREENSSDAVDNVTATKSSDAKDIDGEEKLAPDETEASKLIEDEELEEGGQVKWTILIDYIRVCSIPLFFAFLLALGGAEGVNLGSRYWLRYWNDLGSTDNIAYYLGIYAALALAYVFLYPIACALFLCFMALRASRVLHNQVVERVMHMPWTFFAATPIGRITSRLGDNVSQLDIGLPDSLYDTVFAFIAALVTVIPTVVAFPAFAAIVAVAGLACYGLFAFYTPASVGYLRFNNARSSIVWSHIDETLDGVDTVKAFKLDELASEMSGNLMDEQQSVMHMYFYVNRWFSFAVTNLSAVVVFLSTLVGIIYVDSISASTIAVAISSILNILQEVSMLMSRLGYTQTTMVSVERLGQYINKPVEDEEELKLRRNPANRQAVVAPGWPSTGRIEFNNVNMRYRDDMPLVLRDLTFAIESGEKVGIVGRTGAGKTSVTLALLRMIELSNGTQDATNAVDILTHDSPSKGTTGISIDGVNIATLKRSCVRERISVIPQESFLFSGTLRQNLDPFETCDDAQLWAVLDKIELKQHVKKMNGALDAIVTEKGDNFSVGQQQLLCLARALLRNSKIVILDEATASIDNHTDNLIQELMRKEFSKCTVLTIAHRVNTVLQHDKILVMDAGRAVEFGTPQSLLANPSSHFFKLVNAHGHNQPTS
ncbi:P-loop containing nucleoside triphosphate hydrolase protein [Phlyctochytrium arcticum]|nr:P-loop containing nucleoside triphosphate hydrolase protein [Phlyctochytrium arcticum]